MAREPNVSSADIPVGAFCRSALTVGPHIDPHARRIKTIVKLGESSALLNGTTAVPFEQLRSGRS